MADASSCDTTSDCYNESLSEMFSEKNACMIIGQKPEFPYYHKNKHNFVDKLFTREIRGSTAIHNYAPEERLITFIPSWRRLSLSHIIPKSALKAGHIIMGLTQCGQFLLTYTYSWEVGSDLYKYLLHWWAFTPNQVARKVAEVSLFGNYTIYRELNISVAQWPMERNKLVIHGLCVMPSSAQMQRVDRAYLTITTVPSLDNCRDCLKVAASYEEEELAANWDSGIRYNCLQHGLTVHTTYEIISPYPRFQPKVCLNYSNHVVVNTGNFLQVFKVELETAKMRSTSNNSNKTSNEKTAFGEDERVLDIFEPECYENLDDKLEVASPKCYSSAGSDIVDEQSSSKATDTSDQVSSNIYGSSQSVCDINSQKEGANLASSIRDEILQDFCEELNIANDSIMLVKHPLSMPHRLPVDLKTQSWLFQGLLPHSSPEPDNTLQEQRNNSICSQDSLATSVNLSSLTSLHNLTLSPTPSSSPRLMSPPVNTSFRHLTTPRRRNNLQSNQQIRNRPSQEAEKAYEFTDDSQEITCEKLSSFRKRRLADKKYEFCDETEDAENIVPFKHIRDQAKYHDCSLLHQIVSPTTSPVMSAIRRHNRHDSDHHSENEDCNSSQDSSMIGEAEPAAEKSVLRPLNQNQLSKGNVYRDRSYKSSSPLVPKVQFLQYPSIKCTAHYKRSYIELDDEMISVITEVEDEETGGYVSYQYVLPMVVHGSGYTQMQMISNSKVEKMVVPCVCINQLSFDIEMFSHHIADWICKQFNKKYWHCSDYDIEIIQICALSGDIICLLMLKIQASEGCGQNQSSQERKQYEVGCEFTWNIETSEYRITRVLPINELKAKSLMQVFVETLKESVQTPWNPTSSIALSLRQKIRQPYARMVRYLETEMTLSADSIVNLIDMDNLVELYVSADYD